MKKNFLVLSLCLFNYGFSQIGVFDIGIKTFDEVKNSESIAPCEVTLDKNLTYCVQNGSYLSYTFENKVLNGIITMDACSSQYAAERKLEDEISREKSSLGIEPSVINGKTYFRADYSPIIIAYSVAYLKQTYFMVCGVFKRM
jgi:hypothetical protein